MVNGVTAISASVRVSSLRCMKYIATSAAFHTANTQSRTAMMTFGIGKKITASSTAVRIAR